MIQPKITVVIPTRQRCDVLAKSLKTVTNQSYDNLEIIVSDNFSCDGTEELVRSINDPRIRYFNAGRRLSMSHNWEYALSHVSGDWVTIIGDDDGLLPESLSKAAAIVAATGTKAIRSSVCSYFWPSLSEKEFGHIDVPLKSGYEIRNSKKWQSNVLRGMCHYRELPMLYNGGFVSTSVLNEIKRKTGSIYRSCIPDVYSAVAISSIIDTYVYSHEPLAINGASRHSTGTSQFAPHNRTESSPSQIFATEGNLPFHEDLPLCADRYYPSSLQALVFESYLQSRDLRDDVDVGIHAEQLRLVLARSGRHEASVRAWGEAFAEKHGLNFEDISSKADVTRFLWKLRLIPAVISDEFNRCSVGSPELPVRDVYDASVMAAAVRNFAPSLLAGARRLARRALRKYFGNGDA